MTVRRFTPLLACALLACPLAVVPAAAPAADYRWTSGFGQGTTEAIIRNGEGGSVNIYCAAGTDRRPGIFLESRGVALAKRRVDVQFVVDGRDHAFTAQDGWTEASARGTRLDLDALARALAESRAPSFIVEYPGEGRAERFSLLNARDALMEGAKSIVAPCL